MRKKESNRQIQNLKKQKEKILQNVEYQEMYTDIDLLVVCNPFVHDRHFLIKFYVLITMEMAEEYFKYFKNSSHIDSFYNLG